MVHIGRWHLAAAEQLCQSRHLPGGRFLAVEDENEMLVRYANIAPVIHFQAHVQLVGIQALAFDQGAERWEEINHNEECYTCCPALATRALKKQPLAATNDSTAMVFARAFPCASPPNHRVHLSTSSPVSPYYCSTSWVYRRESSGASADAPSLSC